MSEGQHSSDRVAKAILLGNQAVGKTSLLNRFADNKFSLSISSTTGISHHTKVIEVDGKRINLQVWDTSGQERFRSMVKSYYKNAMGVILAYSIEDRESFAQIENWMEQIIDNSDKSICIILVATKSDLPREISYEEGENLANKYKINFFETSAKNGTNIDETFYRLTAEIKKTFLDKQDTTEFKSFGLDPTKALVSKTEQEQKSCAC